MVPNIRQQEIYYPHSHSWKDLLLKFQQAASADGHLLQALLQWQKTTQGSSFWGASGTRTDQVRNWRYQGFVIWVLHGIILWGWLRFCWVQTLVGHFHLPSPSPSFLPHTLIPNKNPSSQTSSQCLLLEKPTHAILLWDLYPWLLKECLRPHYTLWVL